MLKNILISKLFDLDILDVALGNYHLTSSQQKVLTPKLIKLNAGIPMDYVLGKVRILGLDLIVNKNTLIPREETEYWLKEIKSKLVSRFKHNLEFDSGSKKSKAEEDYQLNSFPNIISKPSSTLIDLGTGTGIIGLYLSDIYKKVYLLDIDKKTLEVTEQNIKLNNRVNCQAVLSNGLENIEKLIVKNEKWDLVANLPYLPDQDIASAKVYKVDHEPEIALYSGQNGLELFDKVLEQIEIIGNKPQNVVFELDPRNIRQAKSTLDKLKYTTKIWLDQNGLERVLVGELILQ
jgi:release factor glutamine methyltransferase